MFEITVQVQYVTDVVECLQFVIINQREHLVKCLLICSISAGAHSRAEPFFCFPSKNGNKGQSHWIIRNVQVC